MDWWLMEGEGGGEEGGGEEEAANRNWGLATSSAGALTSSPFPVYSYFVPITLHASANTYTSNWYRKVVFESICRATEWWGIKGGGFILWTGDAVVVAHRKWLFIQGRLAFYAYGWRVQHWEGTDIYIYIYRKYGNTCLALAVTPTVLYQLQLILNWL